MVTSTFWFQQLKFKFRNSFTIAFNLFRLMIFIFIYIVYMLHQLN